MKKILLLSLIILIPILTMAQGKKELEEQLADLSDTVSALHTEKDKLQSDLAAHKSKYEDLSNTVSALHTEKDKLQNDLAAHRSKYEEVLEVRVEQEKEVGKLNNKIDSLSALKIPLSGSTSGTSKAELVEFTPTNAKFTVPASKTWHITNVFCERNYQSGGEEKDAAIILKSINDVEFEKGPLLFYYNSGLVMNFPIILKEGTSFEFTVKNSGGKAIMTYIEYDN